MYLIIEGQWHGKEGVFQGLVKDPDSVTGVRKTNVKAFAESA
jgi:hypothetical protein